MAVPKASVDENDTISLSEHDVGSSGLVGGVKAVAVSHLLALSVAGNQPGRLRAAQASHLWPHSAAAALWRRVEASGSCGGRAYARPNHTVRFGPSPESAAGL